MSMGSSFSKRSKPEVGLQVYTKAEAAGGPRSSRVDAEYPVPAFARGCHSAIVSVWTSISCRLVSVVPVLGSARVEARVRHNSQAGDTTPGEAGGDV